MSWSFPYRGEIRDLDDTVRSTAAGSFIWLSQGCTHYELAGPETRRPVVLIHGFSAPYFIWDTTFAALRSAGHRVLRYDVFGRGYSDRPRVRYTLPFFVQQLADLLDALQITEADLVGLSMGGVTAAAFTVQSPNRVRHLVLIDPVGTEPTPLQLVHRLALLPGVSEAIVTLLGSEKMIESVATDFFDPSEVERVRERYRAQMELRGFKRAIISTLRNKAVDGSPETYERLGRLDTPVLLLWGRDDRTLPVQQSRALLERVPRAEFHVIEGAGHTPHVDKPDVVHPILLKFLESA